MPFTNFLKAFKRLSILTISDGSGGGSNNVFGIEFYCSDETPPKQPEMGDIYT